MLGNEETANDMVQETFMKLYELGKKGHEPRQVLPWLYKVSGNLCINRLKRTGKKSDRLIGLGIALADSDDPESTYIKRESDERIREIIHQLTPRQQLLILGYQDGLSYRELSLATGIAYNSIGKTLWRTIGIISNKFKDEEDR